MARAPSPELTSFIAYDPVIIGGGPCGATLALLLQSRGIPVTLVDSTPHFTDFDYSKSYSFRLNLRAISTLSVIPELLERVQKQAVATKDAKVLVHGTKGNVVNMSPNIQVHGHPDLYVLRTPYTEECRSLAQEKPLITTMYGSTLVAIQFFQNGQVELTVRQKDRETKLFTRLVLACDGLNSTTARLVREALNVRFPVPHQVSNGLGRAMLVGTSTKNLVQSICVDKSFFHKNIESDALRRFAQQEDVWHWIPGTSDGLNTGESCMISCVPMAREWIDKLGGQLATVCATKQSGFWDLGNVEEGFRVFKKRFPQLEICNMISKDAMQAFIESTPTSSPCFSRMDSFTVLLGDTQNGGIAYLGDAARSVSPITGEGMNAGLLDVKLFMEALDANADSGSLRNVFETYERKASTEADAIIKLGMRMAEERRRTRSFLQLGKSIIRMGLAKIAPGHLYKSILSVLKAEILYSDVLQIVDRMARIEKYVAAVFGVFLPAVACILWVSSAERAHA